MNTMEVLTLLLLVFAALSYIDNNNTEKLSLAVFLHTLVQKEISIPTPSKVRMLIS